MSYDSASNQLTSTPYATPIGFSNGPNADFQPTPPGYAQPSTPQGQGYAQPGYTQPGYVPQPSYMQQPGGYQPYAQPFPQQVFVQPGGYPQYNTPATTTTVVHTHMRDPGQDDLIPTLLMYVHRSFSSSHANAILQLHSWLVRYLLCLARRVCLHQISQPDSPPVGEGFHRHVHSWHHVLCLVDHLCDCCLFRSRQEQ